MWSQSSSKVSQSSPKIVSNLCQGCVKVVSKFCHSCVKVVSKLAENCLVDTRKDKMARKEVNIKFVGNC